MKHLIISLFFTLSSAVCAQTHKVIYHATLKILKPKSQSGKNTLLFDSSKALYVHDEYPSKSDYVEKGQLVTFIKGDSEGLPVYRDMETNQMIWKEDYSHPQSNFIWSESIPNMEWTLKDSIKKISQYECRKARANYAGRTYTAWYTLQIPSPFGPYKFGGLPGLILEIYSSDGRIRYDFVSYTNRHNDSRAIEPPVDGTPMDSIKYYKFMKNKLEKAESVGATSNDPPKNWDIEYNKHRMYKKIKKERGY